MALRIDVKHLRLAGVDDDTILRAVKIAEKDAAETNRANTKARMARMRERQAAQDDIYRRSRK